MDNSEPVQSMFDEEVETYFTESGKTVQQRTLPDDPLNSEAMRSACEKLVNAHLKFEKFDRDPRKYYEPNLNLAWWHAMNKLYEAERRVWRLFVGDHPDLKSNMHFATWRLAYLQGRNIKEDA